MLILFYNKNAVIIVLDSLNPNALVQHMTDFCQTVSMSRPFGTLGVSLFRHRTALRLYGVTEIQPLRGCKKSVLY